MVTSPDKHNNSRSDIPHTYYGLPTDEKPLDANNGSKFIEMYTSKLYLFDAEGSEWLEWGAS